MAYRKSEKYRQQLANMRAAKAAKRESGPAPDYPASLPDLRRRIIIIDYDFGERIHTLDLIINSAWWAWHGKWADMSYWMSAFGITATVTWGYNH